MRFYRGKILKPGDYTNKSCNARIERCAVVAKVAEDYGTTVMWAAMALAFKESNFDLKRRGKDIERANGELGMMQVMVKTCLRFDDISEEGVCQDPVEAGVRHLAAKLAQAKAKRCGKNAKCLAKYDPDDLRLALSYYNGTRGEITNYGREVAKWAVSAAKRHRRWKKRKGS